MEELSFVTGCLFSLNPTMAATWKKELGSQKKLYSWDKEETAAMMTKPQAGERMSQLMPAQMDSDTSDHMLFPPLLLYYSEES